MAANQAPAAWNNVFQPTLFERFHNRTSNAPPVQTAYSAPILVAQSGSCATCQAPAPAPASTGCNSCNTSYSQRCYYQPVTSYQTQSYYESVTSYRTSYYYAPVTSYRYSSYYDPSTCSYQQVACPQTSYELRSQSCPVQNWVQRCYQVPVTTYQKSCYWQPQTTCCSTTQGAPIAMDGSALQSAPPQVNTYATPPSNPSTLPPVTNSNPPAANGSTPPSISEQHSPTSSGTSFGPTYDRYYPQAAQPAPTPSTSFQPRLGLPEPITPSTSATPPPPPVKLDRVAVAGTSVQGQVVRSDNAPRPNAKVLFVNGPVRQSITANDAGRFQVNLAPGTWLVYLQGSDETPMYYTSLNVTAQQPVSFTMVNRN